MSGNLIGQTLEGSLSDVRLGLKEVKDVQQSMLHEQLESRIQRVVNTASFVRSSNVSLNALVLSNSLTDYLNNVSDLNNPSNRDLGFSLVQVVDELVEENIFKGKNRAGGSGKSKFMQIVNGILEMPLTKTFTSTIPVVSSLTAITQLVTNTTVVDKNLSVNDLAKFRDQIGIYITHYEGLSVASKDFEMKVGVLSERTLAVQLMLRNFTYQRIGALSPSDFQTTKSLQDYSIREIIVDYYNRSIVESKVNKILADHSTDGVIDYQAVLAAPELDYPDFVVNEARFVLDEIETISKEYLVAFDEYQEALEVVLHNSKDFGNPDKIDRKIESLKKKLADVEEAFLNAVHVEEVDRNFNLLVETKGRQKI
jgi:hypothetical protein